MDNERIRTQFGHLIRKYRKQNLKSIEQLAEEININEKHLGEIERGNHSTTLENYYKMYKVLNIPDHFWAEVSQSLQDKDK